MIRCGRICVTSDLHGSILPDPENGDTGVLALAACFHKDENTLILDCGDAIQGSPLAMMAAREKQSRHPFALAMNQCGYDAITLGNHDWNYGVDYLSTYLNTLEATCLCANIRDKEGKLPVVDTQIMTLGNGLRVGLTGICTDYLTHWEAPHTLRKLEIMSALEGAKRAYQALQGNCDVTVCLYHGGLERDLTTGKLLSQTGEDVGCQICRELSYDILLTGHQHQIIPGHDLFGTWVVQPGSNGGQFVELEFQVAEDGTVTVSSQVRKGARPERDTYPEELAGLGERTEQWLCQPLATLDRALPGEDPLSLAWNGSAVAELLNQMQMEVTGADISATCLDRYDRSIGPVVSARDILESYRFANTLKVVEITGGQLKRYLEQVVSYFHREHDEISVAESFLKPKESHYNYDYIAGVDYTIDLTRPVGERVVALSRMGKQVEEHQVFSFAVTSYRSAGGGGYEEISNCPVVWESQEEISRMMLQYLQDHPTLTVKKRGGLHIQHREVWRLCPPRSSQTKTEKGNDHG